MNFCYGFEWKLRRDERQCLPEIVCDFSPDGVKAEKTLDLWARTELQRGTVKCLKWKIIIELIKYRHRLQLSSKTNTFIISMTRQLYYSPQASRPKPCVFPKAFLFASPRTFSLSAFRFVAGNIFLFKHRSISVSWTLYKLRPARRIRWLNIYFMFHSRSSSPFLILLFKCFGSTNF